ncbi:MAG: HD domain-containing protein [Saonia sp.]
MKSKRLSQQLDFIKEIDKIKYIRRKTKLFHSDRNENNAEHSWHLAMMALVLMEHANEKIDILKVLKMVLIHDIVEIDSGDIFIYDTSRSHVNTVAELKAANRIFGILPQEQAAALIDIWIEFEEAKTKEAKFAKAMDRFQPTLQNAANKGGTWKEFEVAYERVYNTTKSIKPGSNRLWEHGVELIRSYYKKTIHAG